MTTPIDPMERRLPATITDLAAARTPDYLIDILGQTARTRQRPAWAFPGRWFPMADIARRPAFVPRLPMRTIALALVIVALLAAAAALYVGSQRRLPAPFGPAKNGLVVYPRDGSIFVTDPVTSRSRLLVEGGGHDGNVQFSPGGTQLAFLRGSASSSKVRLMVADADGSNVRAATTEPLDDIPSWLFSPDGRSIAIGYTVGTISHAAIVHLDGSTMTEIDIPGADSPAWRPPDGEELVVRGQQQDGTRELFLVRADGSDVRSMHLQNPGLGGPDWDLSGAAWSPDGTRLAYNSVDPYGGGADSHFRVHVVRADGTGDMALPGPEPDVFEGWANWSPDGRTLFVQRWTNGPQAAMIGLVPADGHDSGRDVGPKLATGEDAFHAAWAPDGTRILAFSDASRMLLSIDTSTYEVTTPAWTITETPDWQRVTP